MPARAESGNPAAKDPLVSVRSRCCSFKGSSSRPRPGRAPGWRFAQGELGDVVFIEIETEGEVLEKGETFGTIEAVKTVSDLYMPVDGEVVGANPALEDTPELVNSEPFGEGWMIRLEPTEVAELEQLLTAEEYADYIGAETE